MTCIQLTAGGGDSLTGLGPIGSHLKYQLLFLSLCSDFSTKSPTSNPRFSTPPSPSRICPSFSRCRGPWGGGGATSRDWTQLALICNLHYLYIHRARIPEGGIGFFFVSPFDLFIPTAAEQKKAVPTTSFSKQRIRIHEGLAKNQPFTCRKVCAPLIFSTANLAGLLTCVPPPPKHIISSSRCPNLFFPTLFFPIPSHSHFEFS